MLHGRNMRLDEGGKNVIAAHATFRGCGSQAYGHKPAGCRMPQTSKMFIGPAVAAHPTRRSCLLFTSGYKQPGRADCSKPSYAPLGARYLGTRSSNQVQMGKMPLHYYTHNRTSKPMTRSPIDASPNHLSREKHACTRWPPTLSRGSTTNS